MSTQAAKARAALDKRKQQRETLAGLWCRVEGHVPAHWAPAVEELDQWLARYSRGERGPTDRLMLNGAPGSAKSTLASLLAARAVTRGISTLLFSYSTGLARAKSKLAQKVAVSYLGAKVDRDARSPGHWETDTASMHASGLSGTGTGFRGPLVIVDDYCLGRAQAESVAHREATNDAIKAVARTRVEPGGLVLCVSTRWHPSDAGAEMIKAGYRVHNVPAIVDGQSYWPERYSIDELHQVEAELGPRDFEALYLGNPSANAALLFKDARLIKSSDIEPDLRIVGGLDCGYSAKTSSDSSVAVVLGIRPNGTSVVIDVLRRQLSIEQWIPELRAFSEKHGRPRFRWAGGGQEAVIAAQIRREGVRVDYQPVRIDKVSRAQSCAAAWNRGQILVASGRPWTDKFVREVCAFPGPHDDQVDALVSAHSFAPVSWVKMPPLEQTQAEKDAAFFHKHYGRRPWYAHSQLGDFGSGNGGDFGSGVGGPGDGI